MRDYIVEEFHRSKNKYIDQNKICKFVEYIKKYRLLDNGYFEKGFSYNNYELIFFVVDYLYERIFSTSNYYPNLPLYFKRMQKFMYYNHPSIINRITDIIKHFHQKEFERIIELRENEIDYQIRKFQSKGKYALPSVVEEFNNKINKLKEEHEKELKYYAYKHKQTENELLNNSTSSHFIITKQGYSKKLLDMTFKFN
eukprot:gene11208-4028_t